MSKNKQHKNGNGQPATQPEQTEQAGQVEQVTKKALSAAEKKALFEAYDAAAAKLDAIEGKVAAAKAQMSDAVKAITEALGAGPFQWAGKELLATSRGDVHYFRGRKERSVETIG